ncbi:single-stranded DNA-binding protein [Candidatus Poriferisocius sp.]|uniref:single-stranded DNA-binding protein n=1 Tax=Candidatus Poriferisocius sp. TaxID=3101276 RepID=UPI003B51CA61
MARSFARVQILGNLGNNPELSVHATKKDAQGNPLRIARFSVATDRPINGGQDSKTDWHYLVAFNGLADIVRNLLQKGTRVLVRANLQYSTYEKDGVERRNADLIAQEIEALSGLKPREEEVPAAQQGTKPAKANGQTGSRVDRLEAMVEALLGQQSQQNQASTVNDLPY